MARPAQRTGPQHFQVKIESPLLLNEARVSQQAKPIAPLTKRPLLIRSISRRVSLPTAFPAAFEALQGFFDITTEPLDPQYSAVLAQAIVDTVRDPLLVLDCHFSVTAASRSFLHVFEARPEDVIGRSVYEILHGCFKIPRLVSLLNKVLPEHAAAEDFEIDAVFPRVGRRALIVSAREVFFVGNTHKAILLSFADETHRRLIEKEKESLHNETRRLLREKEVLLLEMQHRIFNSLQIIANILMMKTRITTSEEARRHLENAYSRVMSVATLQRHIDTAGRSELVEVVPYLTTLCDGLSASVIGEEAA